MTARSDKDAPKKPSVRDAGARAKTVQVSASQIEEAAVYTPDAPTRLMPPPLEDSEVSRVAFERDGATTVQPISLDDFDELPDGPPLVSDPLSQPIADPFDGQATQVDYRSYGSEDAEATGAFVLPEEVPSPDDVAPRVAPRDLPPLDDDDEITETVLTPPPGAGMPPAPDRPATGMLLVDELTEGRPISPSQPAPVVRAEAPTLRRAPGLGDALSSTEAPRAPPRATPAPPTPSQFHVAIGAEADGGDGLDPDVTDPSLSAQREVELHRWRIVPTLLAEIEQSGPGGVEARPPPLPDLRAVQTVLWSLDDERAQRAQSEPQPVGDGQQVHTVLWRPEDAEEPTGVELGAPVGDLPPPPSAAAARAAAVYIHDGVAYLRSLHAYAVHLDEDARREFMARALGAAEKLRRALALLHAAPLDDERGDDG